jgi:hypothetical protein
MYVISGVLATDNRPNLYVRFQYIPAVQIEILYF